MNFIKPCGSPHKFDHNAYKFQLIENMCSKVNVTKCIAKNKHRTIKDV